MVDDEIIAGSKYTEMAKFIDENGQEREDVFFESSLVQSFNNNVENSSFRVYGVVGDWGSGKTTFVKLWENYLKENRNEEFSLVHVDAFAKDYIEDPFSMLIDVFNEYMRENKVSSENARKLMEKAKKIGIASAKALAYAFIQKISGGVAQDFLNKFIEEYDINQSSEDRDPCDDLRNELAKIVKLTNKKLYIIVDELDRCRPDFALECLERIKHLFSVDGVKFILVYNPKIISGIVKSKYGCDEYDARTYINKFVDSEYNLSLNLRASLSRFIQDEASRLVPGERRNVFLVNTLFNSSDTLALILADFGVTSLRNIRALLVSITSDWLPRRPPYSSETAIWLILPLLKMIDYEEFKSIESYLMIDQSLAMNNPIRKTFYRIAHYLMPNKDESEADKQLEAAFEVLRSR